MRAQIQWGTTVVAEPNTPVSGAAATSLTVESFDNHVYFYTHVDADRCLALMQQLRMIDDRLCAERLARSLPEEFKVPIWLHINTGGGDLFSAFAVADQIQQVDAPIWSVVEGVCASAGTIISTACEKRCIQPHAYMMIHEFFTWFAGKHEEFKDEMRLQEMLIARMAVFYEQHTKLSAERIRDILTHDYWMDAEAALADGFVDEILSIKPRKATS